LRITLDSKYPNIIDECARAMEVVCPGKHAHVGRRKSACVDVGMYWKHWPCLFPQHGRGRKHERPIRLEEWQQEVVDAGRPWLLRGLTHSDGCRFVARDPSANYVRYSFSNLSADILRLFCETCDALGITWTRSDPRTIAISRRPAVRTMERLVGRKD